MSTSSTILQKYINKLLQSKNLTEDESYLSGNELLNVANPIQVAGFLSLLTAKGETVDELVGLVRSIREHAVKLNIDYPTLDIVGTGGDNSSTLNISTASCLLSAACGIPVLKHGNRAISSRSGAADVLEVLGYPINLSEQEIKDAMAHDNFAFCFAPNYHPLLAKVREIRKSLGFATVFNLLGPLLNPVGLDYMLIGVYDKTKLELIANALFKLGTKHSVVLHGNGLDELSCLGKIDAYLVTDKEVTKIIIDPTILGLKTCTLEDLHGEDAYYNARIIQKTLSGIKTGLTDTLVLNTAVALFVFGKAKTIEEGIQIASNRLSNGNILKPNKLSEIIARKVVPVLSDDLKDVLALIMKQPDNLDFIHKKMPILKKHKSFKEAILAKSRGAVISEIKRASPSAGKITTIDDPVKRAELYVASGAAAVSVLTDEGFDGRLEDLKLVALALKNTKAAVLRKEFILYPEQVIESKISGADAILLMVSVLGEKTIEFVELAHACGLETLVEIHSPYELEIARRSKSDLIGVNQRDLRDFTMHPQIFSELVNELPTNMVKVAESGIKTSDDAKSLFLMGYDAVLVGETLSRLDSPAEFFVQIYQ